MIGVISIYRRYKGYYYISSTLNVTPHSKLPSKPWKSWTFTIDLRYNIMYQMTLGNSHREYGEEEKKKEREASLFVQVIRYGYVLLFSPAVAYRHAMPIKNNSWSWNGSQGCQPKLTRCITHSSAHRMEAYFNSWRIMSRIMYIMFSFSAFFLWHRYYGTRKWTYEFSVFPFRRVLSPRQLLSTG